MSILKSDEFISDVESQFEWYAIHADLNIADRYLQAIASTCGLLDRHPLIGPSTSFSHPILQKWRFIVVFRPFQKHVIFYETEGGNLVLRRAMHGHRNLPKDLI